MSLTYQFGELDGSHPADVPIPNRHKVKLDFQRTILDLSTPWSEKLQIGLRIPYDRKNQDVEFETLEGEPFDNPVGAIHHRDETLTGLGDLELSGRSQRGNWHFLAGLSLPTGRTEHDPILRAKLGRVHRHILFGTGTVDPVLRASYTMGRADLSLHVDAGVRASLYKSHREYRGPTVLDYSVGPRAEVLGGLGASLGYAGIYETRAKWHGHDDENSGYFLQGIRGSLSFELGKGLFLRPSALYVYRVDTRTSGDVFKLDWIFGISLDYIFAGRDEPPQPQPLPGY